MDKHEIGKTRHKFQAHPNKSGLQECPTLVRDGLRARLVFEVGETGQRPGLRDAVGVEGLAGFLQNVDHLRRGDAVADAQAGEALDLGKRPQHDHVAPLVHVAQGIGRIVEELVVRLVENDRHPGGDGVHEPVDGVGGDDRAGGVVRVGDVHLPGARGDGGQGRIEVLHEAGQLGHFHRARAEKLGHQVVHGERVLGSDHLVAGPQEGVAEKLDDLVGAVAEEDVFAPAAEFCRDGLAQVISAAVGIELGAVECAPHRRERLGRGAEGVFVGGQLDDLPGRDAEFAGEVLDGLAGLVTDEFAQLRVGVGPEGGGHRGAIYRERPRVTSDKCRDRVCAPVRLARAGKPS